VDLRRFAAALAHGFPHTLIVEALGVIVFLSQET
jgi:hypothetical protein